MLLPLILACFSAASDTTLIPFSLSDQTGHIRSRADYAGQALLVVEADRGGSKFTEAWGRALGDSLRAEVKAGRVALIGVADTRGVPGFLRSWVRKLFPRGRMVLMDWDGIFARAYGLGPGQAHVLAFAPDGKLARRAGGEGVDLEQVRDVTIWARKTAARDGGPQATGKLPPKGP